jgi:hypothetical protein
MSTRHRSAEVLEAPRVEIRAHARGERHRINSELHIVTNQIVGGVEPDDADDPGAAWKPVHHHDPQRAIAKVTKSRRRMRHWKVKEWKRRTAARREKASAFKLLGQEP